MTKGKYDQYLKELKTIIPKEEYLHIISRATCEYDCDYLGSLEIYKPLSELIPKNKIVIDFGCYLAPQSYFFSNHKGYIGVDLVDTKRFTPANATHYTCSIQDFIKSEVPRLFEEHDKLKYCAICSYVPDFKATELVRKTFPNVFCYYPSRD